MELRKFWMSAAVIDPASKKLSSEIRKPSWKSLAFAAVAAGATAGASTGRIPRTNAKDASAASAQENRARAGAKVTAVRP